MRTREKGKESAEHFIFWSEAEDEKQKWSRKERVNRTSRQTHPRLGFQTSWTGIKLRRRSESNKIGTTKRKPLQIDRWLISTSKEIAPFRPYWNEFPSTMWNTQQLFPYLILSAAACPRKSWSFRKGGSKPMSLCVSVIAFPSILFTTSESCSLKSESSSFTP